MQQRMILPLLILLSTGCVSGGPNASERFLDAHYVLRARDNPQLDGPYELKDVVSANAITVEDGQTEMRIAFRGCDLVQDKNLTFQAEKMLGGTWPGGVYLLGDSIVRTGSNIVKGIVYTAANRVWIGKDNVGKLTYTNITYTMPQLLLLTHGYCLLDRSDTNYPLYSVFQEAERLAKKNRMGYWADHDE